MPKFSNSDKQEHGKNAKSALESILLECKNYAYIKEIIKDYRCGYAEYDNSQFYCNFVIVFQRAIQRHFFDFSFLFCQILLLESVKVCMV